MAIVYLGIGSNLGNRKENIKTAKALLKASNIAIVQCSSLIETTPLGGPPDQQNYFNGVVKVETFLPPQKLLDLLKSIESKLGREKTVRNGPRLIDLDILLYDQLQLQTSRLTIPHPRMFERDFVMNPLREIDPQLTAAILNKNGEPRHQLNDGGRN